MRRNRFKNKPKAQKAPWQWPAIRDRVAQLRAPGGAVGAAGGGAGHAQLGAGPAGAASFPWTAASSASRPGQIEKAVAPFTQAGFMSADLDAIQRAVEALPWVEHARIQRRWPNSLHVTVVEQTAAARWGDSGLLNTRGELFVRSAAHVPAELPRLSGPEGTESEVAQRYLSIQGRMLEAGMRIAALRLDERGAWEMDLDSGVTVRLGRREVDERIDRFIHTASQVISHRMNEITYVDMRYSNGFAIGWRNPARAGDGAGQATRQPTPEGIIQTSCSSVPIEI